jgi:hypothetical protein
MFPAVVDEPVQKMLFETMVDHEASKDCLIEVERYVKEHNRIEHELLSGAELKKALTIWQTIN